MNRYVHVHVCVFVDGGMLVSWEPSETYFCKFLNNEMHNLYKIVCFHTEMNIQAPSSFCGTGTCRTHFSS